jgi:LPS export ABC transporter protein LptC
VRQVLIVAALLALLGCSRDDDEPDVPSNSGSSDREIHGFTLSETHDGKRLWVLRADRALRFPEEPHVELEGVRLDFYDSAGEVSSRLTSQRGVVDEKTEDLTAKGKVLVISTAGDTLETEELHYNREEELITGPDRVRLAKPDQILTGVGFRSKPDLSDYRVERDVQITYLDRDGTLEEGP